MCLGSGRAEVLCACRPPSPAWSAPPAARGWVGVRTRPPLGARPGRIFTRSTFCCLWEGKVERVGSAGTKSPSVRPSVVYAYERSNARDLRTSQRSAEPRKPLASARADLGSAEPAPFTQPKPAGANPHAFELPLLIPSKRRTHQIGRPAQRSRRPGGDLTRPGATPTAGERGRPLPRGGAGLGRRARPVAAQTQAEEGEDHRG
jgi:hypothetical protein